MRLFFLACIFVLCKGEIGDNVNRYFSALLDGDLGDESKINASYYALRDLINDTDFQTEVDFQIQNQLSNSASDVTELVTMQYIMKPMHNILRKLDDLGDIKTAMDYHRKVKGQDGELLLYLLSNTLFSRYHLFKLAPPNWFEVFPNLVLPQSVIKDLKRRKTSALLKSKKKVAVENFVIRFDHFNGNSPESKVSYFRDDLALSNMFVNWHIQFPVWPEAYFWKWEESRGGHFLYFVKQLVSRYNVERIRNGLEPTGRLHWGISNMGFFDPDVTNKDGSPITRRVEEVPTEDNTMFDIIENILKFQNRIMDIIDTDTLLHVSCEINASLKRIVQVSKLGDIILGYEENPKILNYGKYFDLGVKAVSQMGKGRAEEDGYFTKMLTFLRDPLSYKFLENIKSMYDSHIQGEVQWHESYYFNYTGISLDSIQVNGELRTFFDYESVDVSNALYAPGETNRTLKFAAKVKRLNHKQFSYTVKLNKTNETEHNFVMLRLFLSSYLDWDENVMKFEEAMSNLVEIDRFLIELEEGETVVERQSTESSIYVTDEAENDEEITFCGFPHNLMLPKGDIDGAPFRLIAYMTPFTPNNMTNVDLNTRKFKSFPLCGSPELNDHFPGILFQSKAYMSENFFVPPAFIKMKINIYHDENSI